MTWALAPEVRAPHRACLLMATLETNSMAVMQQTSDYFSIFNLPRKLELDAADLEREFYKLSRKLHPDAYAQSSADQQALALDQSSRLNDAYRTLRDPIARTEYLLQLNGVK